MPLYLKAQTKIHDLASDGSLVEDAEVSTQSMLIRFLQRLGFKHVTVGFD
jgi:hypothetical protein